jgi:hypothetical protein
MLSQHPWSPCDLAIIKDIDPDEYEKTFVPDVDEFKGLSNFDLRHLYPKFVHCSNNMEAFGMTMNDG